MVSTVSEVSICNLALSHIGEKSITSLSDDVKPARECNRLYAITRDMEFRAHNWNFSIKRTNLSEDGTEPDSEYKHRYQVPAECLRILEVLYANSWRVEGGNLADAGKLFILTNLSGPIYIRYVAQITDPAVFDVLFVNALAARLAMDLVEPLSQSNTKAEMAAEKYRFWIGQAKSMDAFESSARPRPDPSWVAARRGNSRQVGVS